ncbi:multidrug RND transporter [Thermococcus siculi]|uniref:Multidrug RND transporter n=1 Tax=Thermococcus siculi TaxID=72803 RepID=A0A2Z2MN96_9EURY|nr:MMPL family transporter [Thermococcus siculi]ASJ08134.1 multidrug RND transporter [Thermococcus siculi]
MAWNEWIARHAKIVMLIWLIAILLLGPMAMKLGSVTSYSMEQMMPKGIESIEVQNIMSEHFVESQNENLTYLIVTNISVNDPDAEKAYWAFKERVEGKYAHNVTSYYDALNRLDEKSHDIALNVTMMTANVTGLLYSTAIKTNASFGVYLDQVYLLANTTETTRESLVGIAGAYVILNENLTKLYHQMNGTAELLREADGAYLRIAQEMPNATEEERKTALESLLYDSVNESVKPLVPAIVETVALYDPVPNGTLIMYPELLENATVEFTYNLMEQENPEMVLPREVLLQVYRSGGDPEIIGGISQGILFERTREGLEGKVPDPEGTAEVLVSTATADPEGILSGETLENATVSAVMDLLPPEQARPELEEIIRALYNGADPRGLAEGTFLEGLEKKLSENLPPETPESVKTAVLALAKVVVRNYPMNEAQVEALVKGTTEAMVEKLLEEGLGDIELNLNVTQLVEIAYEFKDNPEAITREDVKPIAEQVYPSLYAIMGSYINMLKSPDNTSIMVTFIPAGETAPGQDEFKYLAENATIVKETALEEFGKYFPNVDGALGGNPIQMHEMFALGQEDNAKTTRVSVTGALIILLILMGTAILATLLPFAGVGTAVMTALGITYLLAKGDVMSVGNWAIMLTVTTALGLGIDYSTYYLHRFREYLAEGYDHEKAVAEALKRSKDAVLASAATDIIAFASFILAWEFPMFRQMGIIAPLAVVSVLVASLTFIPAMTALIGDKPFFWWPRKLEKHLENVDIHERSRIAGWVVRHAKLVLVLGILIAAPATYAFFTFEGSHDMTLFMPENSETYKFIQLSLDKFGAAVASPYYVILEFNGPITNDDLKLIMDVSEHISGMEGVTSVYSPVMPYGTPVENLTLDTIKALGGDRYISDDGSIVLIQVSAKYDENSNEAKDLIRAMRDYVRGVASENERLARGMVGGNAALSMDLSDKINDVFWNRILPVALLLMFLSLIPTLKGLPAVFSTIGTIFLGVMTSIWVSTWLFEEVFGQQVMWFLPLMVFVVLMGVGIDYNSFYLVKARDEFERRKPEEALIVAAGTMDVLVIGLAAVLAVTYGSLVLSGTWGMREIGFTLAAGVLLTATLAVYFIGPAFMSLFGKKAWWPLFKEKSE